MTGHRPLAPDLKPFLSISSPDSSIPARSFLRTSQPEPDPSASTSLSQLQNQVTSLSLSPVPLPNRIIPPALYTSVEAWTDVDLTVTESREDSNETGIIRVLMQNQQSVGSSPFLPPPPRLVRPVLAAGSALISVLSGVCRGAEEGASLTPLPPAKGGTGWGAVGPGLLVNEVLSKPMCDGPQRECRLTPGSCHPPPDTRAAAGKPRARSSCSRTLWVQITAGFQAARH